MSSQLLCRPLCAAQRIARRTHLQHAAAAMHPVCALPLAAVSAAAASASSAAAISSSVSSRSLHTSPSLRADPAPAKAAPKAAGGGGAKKKKEVVAAGPMHVPASMSEYDFSFLSVMKEYKAPDEKVVMRPDAAYPEWIWDQTPEPTWSDLLLADFASLPPNYQKKVFSMPRKQEIKRKNELTRKG